MIDCTCIFCKKDFQIKAEGTLADHEYSTLDCSHCKAIMIIIKDELKDFNEYLTNIYKKEGIEINENEDVTKTYLEF